MRFRLLAFTAVLAVALSGCLQVRTLLTVFADGSGTITYTLQMRSDAFAQLQSFSKMEGSEKEDAEFSLIDEAGLKAQAARFGPDVVFEGVEPLLEVEGPGYVATYRVPDVTTLALPVFPDAVLPDNDLESDDPDLVTFAFDAGSPARLTIQMPEMKADTSGMAGADPAAPDSLSQAEREQFEQMRMLFEGMRFATVVRPDGTVREADVPLVEGKLTLAELDFATLLRNPEALRVLQGENRPTSPAAFREAVEGLDGLEMVTEPTLILTFESN